MPHISWMNEGELIWLYNTLYFHIEILDKLFRHNQKTTCSENIYSTYDKKLVSFKKKELLQISKNQGMTQLNEQMRWTGNSQKNEWNVCRKNITGSYNVMVSLLFSAQHPLFLLPLWTTPSLSLVYLVQVGWLYYQTFWVVMWSRPVNRHILSIWPVRLVQKWAHDSSYSKETLLKLPGKEGFSVSGGVTKASLL